MIRLKQLLDPDTKILAFDKLQHFASGFIGAALLSLRYGFAETMILALLFGIVYEFGQTDIAYSIKDAGGNRYVGRPGFGFGLVDLAADVAGALFYFILLGH